MRPWERHRKCSAEFDAGTSKPSCFGLRSARRCLTWGSAVICGICALAALFLFACSTLLGVDSGLPIEDGGQSFDATSPGNDAGADGGNGIVEAGPCETGKPDLYVCNGRCGTVSDSCGNAVNCGATCAGNSTCNTSKNICECSAPDWCHGRCGPSIDYCGVSQTCICPTGTTCDHSTGYCSGCIANPLACNGKNCGAEFNGCINVSCGTCSGSQHCRITAPDTAGTCCTPQTPQELCMGKCAGTVVDPCTDHPTDCATVNMCADTQQCQNNACCLRNDQPCSATGMPCCSGHCAASVDAGDGSVTPQVCAP